MSVLQLIEKNNRFADLAGYIARIGQFVFALEEYASNAPMQYHDSDEESDKDKLMVKVQDLTYAPSMESQTAIVQGLFFTAIQGQHVILSGRSGCGKSTALKVLAGLWEPLSGLAHVPRGQSTYFMPQSAYLIVGGTLKEQLTYPESPEAMTDAEMHSLLEESEISSLLSKAPLERDPSRAIQSEDWTASLSAGEKQRIAFARMLWRSPKFTFMDEGTVHLNAELESRLLAKAVKRGITFIAVSHSPLPCLSGALHVNVDEFACGL